MIVFIPGKLRNPLNGSFGTWYKHARLAKDWRERTAQYIFATTLGRPGMIAASPKRVAFTAHVGAPWDDDNLPGAVKPIRDALVECGLLHSDAPDSGHIFVYHQVVDRAHRGVEIIVEPLE